jgi:hypothetical protein
VLRDREESSWRLEQIEEHIVMVGSWPCKVSSEIHINGRRVSESIREDKAKTMATEPEDGKDPKRACVVLSKGHEVVRLGYSRLTGAAAKVTDREENSGTPTGLAKIEAQINEKNKLARITGLARWATWSR